MRLPLTRWFYRIQHALSDGRVLWWPPRRRRWLTSAVVLLSAGFAVAEVIRWFRMPDLNRYCATRAFTCGVAESTVSTLVLAVLVSLIWIGIFQHVRVTRRYRQTFMTGTPSLATHALPSLAAPPLGRDSFATEVLYELKSTARHEPLLVVGESGSGKTTLISLLARELARSRVVPIVIDGREEGLPTDFEAAAKQHFVRAVDAHLLATDHADRIWRRLVRRSQVVILFDALDETRHKTNAVDWRTDLIRTFGHRRGTVPIILATRPQSLPDALPGTRMTLPHLSMGEAAAALPQDTLRAAGADSLALVESLAAHEVPFFLSVLRLVEPQTLAALRPDRSVTANRATLVRGWLADLSARFPSELAALGLAFLESHQYELSLTRLRQAVDSSGLATDEVRWQAALETSLQIGLLRSNRVVDDTIVSVAHPLLLVHLISVAFEHAWDQAESIVATAEMPEAVEALAWCAATSSSKSRWLRRAETLEDPGVCATAVARVCAEASLPAPGSFVAAIEQATWKSNNEKRDVLRAVQRMVATDARDAVLLHFLADTQYLIRWSAATLLATTVEPTSNLLRWLRSASERGADPRARARDVRLLGEGPLWVGPSLVQRHPDDELLSAWAALEAAVRSASHNAEPGSPGAESSLSQGYKLTALQRMPPHSWRTLEFLVRDARFWFARVEAVMACAYFYRATRDDRLVELSRTAESDRHPFVQAAARLAARVSRGDEPARHLWVNERASVDDVRTLSPAASFLLADVLVWLNLNAQGDQSDRDRLAVQQRLPLCLTTSAHRDRLSPTARRICSDACGFRMCPYPAPESDFWNRGQLPESFCRLIRRQAATHGAPAWFHGSARTYAAFWREQERQAF